MPAKLIEAYEALPVQDPLIVLYGPPSSTKTSLAFTADEPVNFDFDLGVARSVGRKRTVRFENWAEVMDFIKVGGDFESLVPRPKTLIADTGGAMLDDYIADHVIKMDKRNGKGIGGGVSLQGFGAMKEAFGAFLRRCRQMDVLPIIICHSIEKQDGDDMRLRPKMTGGAYDMLVSKADLVGYMEMKDGQATINFNPTSRQIGKNCVNFPIMQVPHYTKPEFHGYMQCIINQTRERLSQMSEEQREALAKVKEMQDAILGATDLPSISNVQEQVLALPPVFQAQLETMLATRWSAIWAEQHIEGATTQADFNNLLATARQFGPDVSKATKKLIFKALTTAAGEHQLVYDKDRDGGTFQPAIPAEENSAQPAKETDKTDKTDSNSDTTDSGAAPTSELTEGGAAAASSTEAPAAVPPAPGVSKLPGLQNVTTPAPAPKAGPKSKTTTTPPKE